MKIRSTLRLCPLYSLLVVFSVVPLEAATRYVLPQVVAGGNYTAYLDIVNLGEGTEQGTVSFFTPNGADLLVSFGALIGSDIPFTVERGGSLTARVFVTTGLSVGYAIVQSNAAQSKLAVSLRYRYTANSQRDMFSVPSCSPSWRFTVPAVSDGVVQSAFGFVNVNNSYVKAVVQLVDPDGDEVGSADVDLPANCQRAKYILELFPSLGKFHGSAVIRFQNVSSHNAEGAVLSLIDDDRVLASTPVTPSLPPVDVLLQRCPTSAEVASINADFTFTWSGDPTAGSHVCTAAQGSADLTEMQRRVYQILLVMKALEFDHPLPWTSQQLYTWFKGAIDGLRFRTDPGSSFCCDPANTINIRVAENSYLALTSDWIAPEIGGGLLDTLVLFVHEARHNQGKPHTCGSDDNTIAELGAWGVQYYLDLWLGQEVDESLISDSRYLASALSHAEMIKNSRFCSEP